MTEKRFHKPSAITSLFQRFLVVVLNKVNTGKTLLLPHLKTRHKSESKNLGRGIIYIKNNFSEIVCDNFD
jgi:hypothetical protein